MKEPVSMATSHATHTSAAFGFALLFGTFALAELDVPIGAAGIVLTTAVAAICIACIIDEVLKYKKDKNHAHLLNILAFLAASVGCSLVSAELMGAKFAPWVGAVPAGLFILATLSLTVSTLISIRKNKEDKAQKAKAALLFIEFLGASALFTGALQDKNILKKTILPKSAITAIASIAGIAALITIALGGYQQYKKLTDNENKQDENKSKKELALTHTLHTMACFGFAALFFTFSLAQQGVAIGAAGIILATAVSAICIGCAIDEGVKYYKEKSKHATHLLNITAFLAAAVGCGLVSAELIGGLQFGAIPAGLFVAATACLTITSIIPMVQHREKRTKANGFKTLFFLLQFAGATALFSGALLHNPSTLGISITATVAGGAAIGTILLGYLGYQALNKPEDNNDASKNEAIDKPLLKTPSISTEHH